MAIKAEEIGFPGEKKTGKVRRPRYFSLLSFDFSVHSFQRPEPYLYAVAKNRCLTGRTLSKNQEIMKLPKSTLIIRIDILIKTLLIWASSICECTYSRHISLKSQYNVLQQHIEMIIPDDSASLFHFQTLYCVLCDCCSKQIPSLTQQFERSSTLPPT